MDMNQARRKRAIAEALLRSSMTPSQPEMVGRFRVGEGLGGVARLGQALLARKFGEQADVAEREDAASKEQAAQGALSQVIDASRSGDNAALAAALMGYQKTTGSELSPTIAGMLKPQDIGADYSGAIKEVIDERTGLPALVQANRRGGVTPVSGYRPKPAPERIPAQVQTPEQKAEAVGAVEEARKRAQQNVELDREIANNSAILENVKKTALEIESLLGKAPSGMLGAGLSAITSRTGMARESDMAQGELENKAANLLSIYAGTQVLGVNPTNADMQQYEKMAGDVANPSINVDIRKAKLKSMLGMLEKRVQESKDKYSQMFSGELSPETSAKRFNPATGRVE